MLGEVARDAAGDRLATVMLGGLVADQLRFTGLRDLEVSYDEVERSLARTLHDALLLGRFAGADDECGFCPKSITDSDLMPIRVSEGSRWRFPG